MSRSKELIVTPLSVKYALVGWLNLFNAEMSRKKHWLGPRFEEVGEEGVRKSYSVAPAEFEKRNRFHSDSDSDSGYCLLT